MTTQDNAAQLTPPSPAPNPTLNKVVLVLVALILFAFALGAYQVNATAVEVEAQHAQIDKIIDEQSPLIFAFENVEQSGTTITFVVNCTRLETQPRYVCTTERASPPVKQTPTPTAR